jgi:hypothetical protein
LIRAFAEVKENSGAVVLGTTRNEIARLIQGGVLHAHPFDIGFSLYPFTDTPERELVFSQAAHRATVLSIIDGLSAHSIPANQLRRLLRYLMLEQPGRKLNERTGNLADDFWEAYEADFLTPCLEMKQGKLWGGVVALTGSSVLKYRPNRYGTFPKNPFKLLSGTEPSQAINASDILTIEPLDDETFDVLDRI